jgi:hypothetical protein
MNYLIISLMLLTILSKFADISSVTVNRALKERVTSFKGVQYLTYVRKKSQSSYVHKSMPTEI